MPSTRITPDPTLAWFPLVPRPRPPGLPFPERITHLHHLATHPEGNAAGDNAMVWADEVLNKAALIASDVGVPDLARTLCWRHYTIFDTVRPLSGKATELALQPVLNLARQLIREGDNDHAYAILHALHDAARS